MKLTLLDKRDTKPEAELIELSCRSQLSKINSNHHETMYLIQQLTKAYQLHYQSPLGYICAHVSLHHASKPIQGPPKEWNVATELLHRYNLIFFPPSLIHKVESHSQFHSLEELEIYAMKVVSYSLSPNLLYTLNHSQSNFRKLKKICSRLLQSLLLEHIPPEYSKVIITIYLQAEEVSKNRDWAKAYPKRFRELYPYHEIFQLLHSLAMHLVTMKNIVDISHFFKLLEHPVMGTVEWPMVIGARDHYDLPNIKQSLP